MMIAIIDYGMGNLYNVKNALDVLGVDSIITSKKEDLQKADKLILPGVGAMQDCMLNLEKSGLKEMITDFVLHQKKPLLLILPSLSFQGYAWDTIGMFSR